MKTSVVCAAVLGVVLAAASAGGCAKWRAQRAAVRAGPSVGRDAEANRIAYQAQEAEKAGKIDRAIELYRESLTVSNNLPATWNNLGRLLMDRTQYLDAVEAFKRAADLSPSDPRPLHNIGMAYSRAGWEQKALEYYLLALECDPRDLTALRGAVGSAKMLGMADEASLERVRTGLMTDTDPDWHRVYEREQSRIEGELRATKRRASSP